MQTIEEFMQDYFAERAELCSAHRKAWDAFVENFFTADYLIMLRKNVDEDRVYEIENPAVVVSVKARKRVTVVTTSEPELGKHVHYCYCYYLLATERGWRIDRKGPKCSSCDGTGYVSVLLSMGQIGGTGGCSTCGGLGWCYGRSGPV